MATHSPKFSPKWRAEVPLCQLYALSRPRGATNSDPVNVDCKRCRKALGLPPLTFRIPEGAHSDKALATIAQMGTKPEQWKVAEIRWATEERMVSAEVTCPECGGWGITPKDEAGEAVPYPSALHYSAPTFFERDRERRDWISKAHTSKGAPCERCKGRNPRARTYGYSTGKIMGQVLAKVRVGYVIWPEGVTFDSRFADRDCQLCGKTIPSGEVVPVHTKGIEPAHGMWVGTDCGRKIFGIELKLKEDQQIERK